MVLNADIDDYNDGRSKDVCMLLNKMKLKLFVLLIITVTISWWIAWLSE